MNVNEKMYKTINVFTLGAVNDLIITARANGGDRMDCYGKYLTNAYENCGYVPVARVPFNPDYVTNAALLRDKPDVYVLMKNNDSLLEVIQKIKKKGYNVSSKDILDNLKTFTDYDEALKYRDKLLKEALKNG